MPKYYIMKNDRTDWERISYTLYAVYECGKIEKISIHYPPEKISQFSYELGHSAEFISPMDAIRMKLI